MNFKQLISILLVIILVIPAFAKEKKKSKKVLEQEALIENATQPLKDKIAGLESQLTALQDEKKQIMNDMQILNEENKALQKEAMQMEQAAANATSVANPSGLFFKVQLGAYSNNIAAVFADKKILQVENVEGKNKYLVGPFTSFENAKNAEKDFKKLGIKDTWLVPYKGDNRISDNEANSELDFDIRRKK